MDSFLIASFDQMSVSQTTFSKWLLANWLCRLSTKWLLADWCQTVTTVSKQKNYSSDKNIFFFKTLIFSEMSFFSILFLGFFAKVSLKWSQTQKVWAVNEKWPKNKLIAPSAIPTKSFSSCGSHSICNLNNLVDYQFVYQERDTDFFNFDVIHFLTAI